MSTLIVDSDLNFGSIDDYLKKTESLTLGSNELLTIDFSNAGDVDSAGVALCLRLLRITQKFNGSVTLKAPSAKLVSLLEACKLKELFQID